MYGISKEDGRGEGHAQGNVGYAGRELLGCGGRMRTYYD